MMSLAKTEENLSSSLLNVTSLDDSLKAAGEKFLFMQKLREFVSVICAFLQVWIILHIEFCVLSCWLVQRFTNLLCFSVPCSCCIFKKM